MPSLFLNAHHNGSLPQQLKVVWSLLLQADPEGPTLIFRAASWHTKSQLAKVMWKAEYVAGIAVDHCNGCRLCRKQCLFEAINYNPATKKCVIEPGSCYGCGICRTVCPCGAITLHPRDNTRLSDDDW